MSKKKAKKKPKRCRHEYGEMTYESDEPIPWQVCNKCRLTRFRGDRYAYGSRWKD